LAFEGSRGAEVVLVVDLLAATVEHVSYPRTYGDLFSAEMERAHVPAALEPNPSQKGVNVPKSGIRARLDMNPVPRVMGGVESKVNKGLSRPFGVVLGSAFCEMT